jgi:hypothetical protein
MKSLFSWIAICLLAQTFPLFAASALKPRLVVLTDIGPASIEPDDSESMVRLCAYADRFEIEGIICGSGWNNTGRAYQPAWMDFAKVTLDAYERDATNLMKRSGQAGFRADETKQELGYWPSPGYLRARLMFGSLNLGFKELGDSNNSAGSDFLIKLADETDERPIWLSVWGGANTFAQAVWRVQKERSPEQLKRFLRKFRIYTITDQDRNWGKDIPYDISSHQWLRREFEKDLLFVWDESAWHFQCDHGKANWSSYAAEVQGHGNLGRVYPKVKWGVEGDTPSFLYVMPNGLNEPEHPEYGGWGGFFALGTGPDNTTTAYVNQPGTPASPISRKYEKRFYPQNFNDFAARMKWAEDGAGNRNPVVSVNGDSTLSSIKLAPKQGTSLGLNASATKDPDGDKLKFSWWVMSEAGSYTNEVAISGSDTSHAAVKVPADSAGKSFHVICEVTDDGKPNLTSYRRIIIEPTPTPAQK